MTIKEISFFCDIFFQIEKICGIMKIGIYIMEANYKKLWKLLIDKDMKKTDLITVAGINSNILAKMGKGESVSMESLKKICSALECDIGDIVTFNTVDNKN